jgi:hypothetical protein
LADIALQASVSGSLSETMKRTTQEAYPAANQQQHRAGTEDRSKESPPARGPKQLNRKGHASSGAAQQAKADQRHRGTVRCFAG